jgi:hypothetical protein
MARIHLVGNSITYGLSGNGDDWSTRLRIETNQRRHRDEKPRITVVNLASPGNMLVHVLDSGLFEASVNCNRRGRQIGVFCVGACEASILRSRGATEPRRSKADFCHDLGRLATIVDRLNHSQAPETQVDIIFMGATPVNNEVSFCSPAGDYFDNQTIVEYDDLVRGHAKQRGTPYVDLRAGFNPDTMLSADGIHLSEIGDDFIYGQIMPVLLGGRA